MACLHRNLNDLDLSYVTWKPKTLFIGTFNPSWNCPNNYSDWFYGRTQRNEFWCILPKVHNKTSQLGGNRNTWISFCRDNQLAITDIISSINDADQNSPDHHQLLCDRFKDDAIENNFNDFLFTDIVAILEGHPSIRQVCITRQGIAGLWAQALNDIRVYCAENNIPFIPLRSPSRMARRGVVGPFCDFIANRWLAQGYQVNPE